MSKQEAIKFLEKYHKCKVTVTDSDGNLYKYSIKSFIPMNYPNKGDYISDVEILLEDKRNHYFSIKMFQEGTSWVKKIELSDIKDNRIKKRKVIGDWRTDHMRDEHFIETAEIVKPFIHATIVRTCLEAGRLNVILF